MEIRIDEIPESAGKNLARKALSGLDAFYADPANRERYEAWKANLQLSLIGCRAIVEKDTQGKG